MKPSEQVAALINQIMSFPEEAFSVTIQDNYSKAVGHLEEIQSELQEAGL
jgi:hypothetical protein